MKSHAIRIAKKVAKNSKHPQHHMAALVLRGGAVVSAAANMGPGRGHAEARAIRPHLNVKGCHLIVVRLGGHQISKPCPFCKEKILNSGITKVSFTDKDGVWKTLHPKEL